MPPSDQNSAGPPSGDPLVEIANFDTCRYSLFHLLAPKPSSARKWLYYLLIFFASCALFYGTTIITAFFQYPQLEFGHKHSPPRVGLLEDGNALFMLGITIPLLLCFLVSERAFIPSSLRSLLKSQVVYFRDPADARAFCATWTRRYSQTNMVGQIAAVGVGVGVAYANYMDFVNPDWPLWQRTGEHINALGWLQIFLHLPALWTLVALFCIRAIATVCMLYSFVEATNIKVEPYHRDNAGGLSPVGAIGLRNSYLLGVAGVNLLLFYMTSYAAGLSDEQKPLIVAAALVYVLLGPVVFVMPLMPFRSVMVIEKRRQQGLVGHKLSETQIRIVGTLDTNDFSEDDQKRFERLQLLRSVVNRIPVWPFDSVTVTRFFTTYVAPALVLICSHLLNWLFS